MEMSELLTRDAIFIISNSGSRKQLIQEISAKGEQLTGITQRNIFDTLFERETLGSTGVGGGIAIPHGTITGLTSIIGIFVRLKKPVDFDSPDGVPIDVVFTLLAPNDAGADHLKALAKIARTLRNSELISAIRSCETADAIFSLMTQEQNARAA